jgi:ABC-type antimicrobial peptide transport system permease subunit
MALLAAFAGVALFLAAVGLYGVLALSVTQRTREMGVRLALGARREDVVALVMRQGVVLVAIGLLGGLVAAATLSRVLRSVLYETTPYDPVAFVAGPIVLATIAVLASYLPARRAGRVDPVVALRVQ